MSSKPVTQPVLITEPAQTVRLAAGLAQMRAIILRELRDQLRDWRILSPIIILTVFFPFLMNFTADAAVEFVDEYGGQLIVERIVPFLLLVVGFFPTSVSLVIALESFVGEKERRSIEPLLSSPLTDAQLYLSKLVASLIPPLIASYLGITVYLVSVYFNIGWTAEPVLLVQVFLLTTAQAVIMVCGAVVISTQTTSVRAANLLSSFILIPMSLFIQGEAVIFFWGEYAALWWVFAAEVLVAGLLIRSGVSQFNREELLGRELDAINLRWMLQTFRGYLTGGARNVGEWLRKEWLPLWKLVRTPVLFLLPVMFLVALLGMSQAAMLPIREEALRLDNLSSGLVQGLENLPVYTVEGVLIIWFHNLRAIALASLLGVFTFGVLGILTVMLPFLLIGFFTSLVQTAGITPLAFLAGFILPHGILEIPAILIAGAAIMRLGAVLAAPPAGRTIGEAWLASLADWVKIMLLIVAPLLLGAAILEIYLTPSVAIWMFGG